MTGHWRAATGEGCLYDRVPPGGFTVVDDCRHLASCTEAVDALRAARRIADPIRHVDRIGNWWCKGEAA
jgi:Macrocin-O-methyltransferase (TylF)